MVSNSCERRQGLGRDRVEQPARIAEARRERASNGEVKLSVFFAGDVPVHLLHLCFEHASIDQRARVRLGQVPRQRGLVVGGYGVSAHRYLLGSSGLGTSLEDTAKGGAREMGAQAGDLSAALPQLTLPSTEFPVRGGGRTWR